MDFSFEGIEYNGELYSNRRFVDREAYSKLKNEQKTTVSVSFAQGTVIPLVFSVWIPNILYGIIGYFLQKGCEIE